MSALSGVGAAATMIAPAAVRQAKPVTVAPQGVDSDGDNDGSRPGEMEASLTGKGGSFDKLA